ncbi:hypothetical protein AHAS_Ahas16G0129200 [Arachis hypogaea]
MLACSFYLINQTSGDGMALIAPLMATEMNKVYLLNRQICVVKLPLVFYALRDILGSKHEEAIYAATDAFKSMINSCIDASLIKQGSNTSCFSYVNKLGRSSHYFMRGILKNLVDVQKLHEEDFLFKKQLHECFGSALVAMGPERLLSLIPLNLEAEDLLDANIWLFPFLKQYIGARLNYFKEEILPMIERTREMAAQRLEDLEISSRNGDPLAYSLWSLLPSFCNYPVDTAECFLLIQQNKNDVKANSTDFNGQDMDKQGHVCYSQQVAKDNWNVLKSSARHLLVALADVFLKPSKDDGGCLQRTIGDIASMADKTVVWNLLIRRMSGIERRLEEAGRVDNSENSALVINCNIFLSIPGQQYVDFVVSLLPGLTAEGIHALYHAIKAALMDAEGLMQKKAYKALSIILKSSDSFVSSKSKELFELMVEILHSCHFSAKRHRLDCLYFLIIHASVKGIKRCAFASLFVTLSYFSHDASDKL